MLELDLDLDLDLMLDLWSPIGSEYPIRYLIPYLIPYLMGQTGVGDQLGTIRTRPRTCPFVRATAGGWHDCCHSTSCLALRRCSRRCGCACATTRFCNHLLDARSNALPVASRSEEHTSELQSLRHLVCRLLLEK